MQTTINTQLNSNPVTGSVGLEELSIAIVANQFNPTILQLSFLQMSGIVPVDWQLQREPVLNTNVAQLVFNNGVTIVAQNNSITLVEMLDAKNINQVKIANIAAKFLEKLPNADYQKIGIIPKSLVGFPAGNDTAAKFMVERLLSPGPWSKLNNAVPQASVNLLYQLDHCQLLLNINEAQIQEPEKSPIAALLFTGSFNYDISNYSSLEGRQEQTKLRLENWSTDLENFRHIIVNNFLGLGNSVF